MGLSIAISGGIVLIVILLIFAILPSISEKIQGGSSANSERNDLEDSISKTNVKLFGVNASSGSNLVNFTLVNEGNEKLWNFDEFDLFITYDADIGGTRTEVTEQFSYNATAFSLSTGQEGETADFNVQRGCTTIVDGASTRTLTSGVDYSEPIGESFIRIVNTRLTGNGNTDGGSTQENERFTVYISDPDFAGGSITFTRDGSPGADDTLICYEIIDYFGLPDGDNVIAVLDRNTVTYASGSTTVSGPSVTPKDDNDIVVFITGQISDENGSTQWNEGLSTSAWNAAADTPDFTRGSASGAEDVNEISYVIVEFTGSNWNIQRVEHNYLTNGIETESITPVSSLSKAFLHTQHRVVAEFGLDELGEEAWLSAVDEISFDLENAADAPFTQYFTVAWVIENTQSTGTVMMVQHISGSRAGGADGEPDTWTETIPTAVNTLGNTAIMGENARSVGGGTAYPRGANALELTADDTVTLTRSDNGQTQNYRFSVVEFPQSLKCVGGTSAIIEVDEWTINCIKKEHFEPGIINTFEEPEILTKLQYPIFTNGLLKISLSTDNGFTDIRNVTVN